MKKVARERWERGAIVVCLAPSWIRFGSFEYFFHTNQHDKLEKLADFLIAENNDFTLVNDLLKIAQNPYAEHEAFEHYAGVTPPQRQNLKLSCSS